MHSIRSICCKCLLPTAPKVDLICLIICAHQLLLVPTSAKGENALAFFDGNSRFVSIAAAQRWVLEYDMQTAVRTCHETAFLSSFHATISYVSPAIFSTCNQVLPPWTLRVVASVAGAGGDRCSMMHLHHMHPLTRPLQTHLQQNRVTLPTGASSVLPPPPLLVLYVLSESSKRSNSRCLCPPDDPSCVALPAAIARDIDRVQSMFHRMLVALFLPLSLSSFAHTISHCTPSNRFCDNWCMYVLSVRDVGLFGMDSRIACRTTALCPAFALMM